MFNYASRILMLICLPATTGCQLWPAGNQPSWEKPPPLVRTDELSDKEAAQACVSAARSLHQQGHLTDAAALLERGRKQNPKSYQYARHLAVLYDELNQPQQAELEFQTALSSSPHDADLWNDYGFFRYTNAHIGDAEQAYRKALAIQPNHQRAGMNLATCLVRQQRLPEAYDAFAAAVGPAAAHQNMGVMLIELGQMDQARVAFAQAVNLDPSLAQSQQFLAQLSSPAANMATNQQSTLR